MKRNWNQGSDKKKQQVAKCEARVIDVGLTRHMQVPQGEGKVHPLSLGEEIILIMIVSATLTLRKCSIQRPQARSVYCIRRAKLTPKLNLDVLRTRTHFHLAGKFHLGPLGVHKLSKDYGSGPAQCGGIRLGVIDDRILGSNRPRHGP